MHKCDGSCYNKTNDLYCSPCEALIDATTKHYKPRYKCLGQCFSMDTNHYCADCERRMYDLMYRRTEPQEESLPLAYVAELLDARVTVPVAEYIALIRAGSD